MRTTDARGFVYVLEPERRRRQWQLDAAMAQLGNLRRQISDSQATLENIEQECVSQAAQAGRSWAYRADPVAHARLLGYIATLQQSRADAQGKIAALAGLLQLARAQCAVQQQKLELLDRHRHDASKHYTIECGRKNAAEADEDWAAGANHRPLATDAP